MPTVSNLSFEAWREHCAPDILGDSPAILDALAQTRAAAESSRGVLLTCERGAGKALFARAIHRGSVRADGPFVVINCAAIPAAQREAELFGALRDGSAGRLVAADRGTAFFEEISDLSLVEQVKLLRAIDQGMVCPLGGAVEHAVDLRVVAATHEDLDAKLADGGFRADLLPRLIAHRIALPPLRARGHDICVIALAMLRHGVERHGVYELDPSARAALLAHPWPGNLPELYKAIERALRYASGCALIADDLDLERRRPGPALAAGSDVALTIADDGDDAALEAALAGVDRRLISQALHQSGGDHREAAARLGVRETALIAKLRKR